MAELRNVVVIGGSYVGVNVAQHLAKRLSGRLRVLLIEKNSHFQHLFAFPRFGVTTKVETKKAFIPFVPGTFAGCPPGSGSVVQAVASRIEKGQIRLDRKVNLDGKQTDSIKYAYLVIATGTKLSAPSTLPGSEKADGVDYLIQHARKVEKASSIAVIGGGAVGVQTATDIKELYPEKSVTLIHSRPTLMNRMNTQLDDLIKARFTELGIETKLGSRVKLPSGGFPTDGSKFNVELQDGNKVPTDFAIICIGQTPQSSLVKDLSPELLTNDGFIKVRKTLQVADSAYPEIFALGDIADTGSHKAARPAAKQAEVVAENIEHLLQNESLVEYDASAPAAIHLTVGLTKSVVFRNPPSESEEPYIWHRDDGHLDMGINGVWERRGGGIDANL
ncbi:Pyridine nucleotide-disulfide oxidoreductase-like protein 7 [Elsinoe fawcettii]|nr:Pyridine nucleotide-disulfide oxidoreductase-like protein 7 [Elsinoe fawcettii]